MRIHSIAFVSLALLLIFSGCVNQTRLEDDPMHGKTVSFETEDGFKLVGTLWQNTDSDKPRLILVHRFSADRHSYDAFAQEAFARGYTVLSFDVRGFGESIQKGNQKLFFTSFTENGFRQIANDIFSAKRFLNAEKVIVMGASIGANAALDYGVLDPSANGLVLLSPGLNYKGIDVNASMIENGIPMLIVASKEDLYSAQSSQTIFEKSPLADKKLLLLEQAGHGTDMFIRNPSLTKTVLDWVQEHE